MKFHGVVGVFWLVVSKWVGEVNQPTVGCMLG